MVSVSLGTEQDPNKREFCYCIADVVMITNILVISPKPLNFTELRASVHMACFPALVMTTRTRQLVIYPGVSTEHGTTSPYNTDTIPTLRKHVLRSQGLELIAATSHYGSGVPGDLNHPVPWAGA